LGLSKTTFQIEKIINSSVRCHKEQSLEFHRLREHIKVVELFPDGDWHAKFLIPLFAEIGQFYTDYIANSVQSSQAGKPGLGKIQVTATKADIGRAEGPSLNTMAPRAKGRPYSQK
jgi:predicted methyltransferase